MESAPEGAAAHGGRSDPHATGADTFALTDRFTPAEVGALRATLAALAVSDRYPRAVLGCAHGYRRELTDIARKLAGLRGGQGAL